MQNILQCICQDSNQLSYKVLFNSFSSSLNNALKFDSQWASWGIFFTLLREPFHASTELWDAAQAFTPKMEQKQNHIGFKSGEEGNQTQRGRFCPAL